MITPMKINAFNDWLALKVTDAISTMWMAYIFAAIALVSLPAALATHQLIIIVAWVAQTFLQLVLLSVIMVGQKLQADITIQHVTRNHAEHMKHIRLIHKKLGIKETL